MRTLRVASMVLLVCALALPAAGFARVQETADTVASQAEDQELEAQVRQVAAKLRCPTCRALSVRDSPSGMALEMRSLIREQLRAGRTPDEVTAYFVDRYGEWILLEPKAEGFNWTVWLLPVVLLFGGLTFVLFTARRWVRQGQARAAAIQQDGQEEEH